MFAARILNRHTRSDTNETLLATAVRIYSRVQRNETNLNLNCDNKHLHNGKTQFLQFSLVLFQKIVAHPRLIVDGISRFDFGQGLLGKNSLFIHKTHLKK